MRYERSYLVVATFGATLGVARGDWRGRPRLADCALHDFGGLGCKQGVAAVGALAREPPPLWAVYQPLARKWHHTVSCEDLRYRDDGIECRHSGRFGSGYVASARHRDGDGLNLGVDVAAS